MLSRIQQLADSFIDVFYSTIPIAFASSKGIALFPSIIRILRMHALGCIAIASLTVIAITAGAQIVDLPIPTGPYAVGRSRFHWVDKSRHEQFSEVPGAYRELMVYIWYPASRHKTTKKAEYVPDITRLAKVPESAELKKFWGDVWPLISSERVALSTQRSPAVAKGKPFPLIVFCPALGISTTSYTSLIQEIVSNGFIVASIEPTYEVPVVVFPDQRIVAFSNEAAERNLPSPPGETREQFLKRLHQLDGPHLDRWAADVHFVIDQLVALNNLRNKSPLAGHIDLAHIAAWGHSFGGRAAARACQLDHRITACLNADGLGTDGPIFQYQHAKLPEQPFLWMEVYHAPPTDAQLAPYNMTKKDWDRNHQTQIQTSEQQLRSCPGGSYHISIDLPGIQHLSFTDKPLIQAKNAEDFADAERSFSAIETYSLAFFNRYLRLRDDSKLLFGRRAGRGVTIERFGPKSPAQDQRR